MCRTGTKTVTREVPLTQTVFLHIGAFKTGTTYLQNVLWNNRARLADEGILVPGKAMRDQPLAALELLDVSRDGYRSPKSEGAWQRLVEGIGSWQGHAAVTSMEFLSLAKTEHVRTVVADLAPAEVHVVLTARDLARVVPAAWQERMRNAKTFTWAEFVAAVQDPDQVGNPPAKGFWEQQDLPAILRRWGRAVPAERVHVVTVPPPGSPPTLLLERFGRVLGSDATGWDPDVEQSNESMGAVEAEFLRRINWRISEAVEWPVYEHAVNNMLGRGALAARPHPRRLVLPPEGLAWAAERAHGIVRAIERAGYPVVGDLGDLVPVPPPAVEHAPAPSADAPTEDVLAAAEDAIVTLVTTLGTRNVELRATLQRERQQWQQERQDAIAARREAVQKAVRRTESAAAERERARSVRGRARAAARRVRGLARRPARADEGRADEGRAPTRAAPTRGNPRRPVRADRPRFHGVPRESGTGREL